MKPRDDIGGDLRRRLVAVVFQTGEQRPLARPVEPRQVAVFSEQAHSAVAVGQAQEVVAAGYGLLCEEARLLQCGRLPVGKRDAPDAAADPVGKKQRIADVPSGGKAGSTQAAVPSIRSMFCTAAP